MGAKQEKILIPGQSILGHDLLCLAEIPDGVYRLKNENRGKKKFYQSSLLCLA